MNHVKRRLQRYVLAALLIFVIVFGSIGCIGNGGDETEEIDPTRTQLYVANYNGGAGTVWIENMKTAFEEESKNESIEPGKTGVQVHVEPGSNGGTSIINTGRYDIIFSEGNSNISDDISNGYLRDITDIVTEPLTEFGETGNIEDKFISENQKSYFHVDFSGSGNKRYYTLPLYSAFSYERENGDFNERTGCPSLFPVTIVHLSLAFRIFSL